jgi:hypothetical protein
MRAVRSHGASTDDAEEEGGSPVHGLYVLALDDLPATAAAVAVE